MPDEAQLATELAKARDLASALEVIFGALIGGTTVVIGVRRWWRRRQHRREEALIAMRTQARALENAVIDERIATALVTFRRTVMDKADQEVLAAVTRIISDHAQAADNQVQTIALAVGRMAQTVEDTCGRLERRVEGCNDRIDDFLRSMAAGQIPHFRSQPRMIESTAIPLPKVVTE